MAVVPVRGQSNSPYNSVNITDYTAVKDQRELVNNWEPKREVWWLKHGEKVVGGMCAVNGLVINSMFRHKLKLRNNGFLLSLLYSSFGPGVLGSFFFSNYITDNILLYKHGCPVCYELKANLIMNTAATVFPLLTMPTLNLAVAASLGLRVPMVYEVRELAKFFWSVVKPGMTHLSFFFVVNSVAASIIAYKQMSAAETIADTLFKIEKYLQMKESNKLLA